MDAGDTRACGVRMMGILLVLSVAWVFVASAAHYHAAPAAPSTALTDPLSVVDGPSVCWACCLSHTPPRATLRTGFARPALAVTPVHVIEMVSAASQDWFGSSDRLSRSRMAFSGKPSSRAWRMKISRSMWAG